MATQPEGRNISSSQMEGTANISDHQHIVIVVPSENVVQSALVSGRNGANLHDLNNTDTPSTIALVPTVTVTSSATTAAPNFANNTLTRRSDSHGRRHRSPLNSGLWISVEVLVNASQIIAAIVVLALSRNEHPLAPLFEWVIGYTVGCFATLPHLYWRYLHRNSSNSEQEQSHSLQGLSQNNPSESDTFAAVSAQSASQRRINAARNAVTANPRINALFDHFKMALDCFFAVWFVVGNVWIFGGHSSVSDAPNLYRLCIVFLTFSCIGYAMPFILCAMICCCLPCIISVMGFREDANNTRGATSESINSLPTYKFKTKKRRGSDTNLDAPVDGGIFAAGTDKERVVSAEDAVCCICLAKYVHNDELRELPCNHFFHKDCVDKWLKINALCPLCKCEIDNSPETRQSDMRGVDDLEQQIEMH